LLKKGNKIPVLMRATHKTENGIRQSALRIEFEWFIS